MAAVYEVWIKKTHKETWSPMLYASVLAMFRTIPGFLQAQSPVKIHVLGPSKLLLGLTETGHSLLKTGGLQLFHCLGVLEDCLWTVKSGNRALRFEGGGCAFS